MDAVDPTGLSTAINCQNGIHIRVSFKDCNCDGWKGKEQVIGEALCHSFVASREIADRVRDLTKPHAVLAPPERLRTAKCVAHWFGNGKPINRALYEQIANTLDKVAQGRLQPIGVRCESSCSAEKYAFVERGIFADNDVHLCPKLQKAVRQIRQWKILHELTHRFAGSEDYGYVFGSGTLGTNRIPSYNLPCPWYDPMCDPETGMRVFLNQQRLVRNAATYEGFVECMGV